MHQGTGDGFGNATTALLQAALANLASVGGGGDDGTHDIGVDELVVLDHEATMRQEVDRLSEEWRALDERYLRPAVLHRQKKDPGVPAAVNAVKGCHHHLAVPQGDWLSDLRHPERCDVHDAAAASHPRIPDEVREEYLTKLLAIFAAVPRAARPQAATTTGAAAAAAAGPTRMLQLKALVDGKLPTSSSSSSSSGGGGRGGAGAKKNQSGAAVAAAAEWRAFEHEFNVVHHSAPAAAGRGIQPLPLCGARDEVDVEVAPGDVVVTFSLHHPESSGEAGGGRYMDLELLGSQTLDDLRQVRLVSSV